MEEVPEPTGGAELLARLPDPLAGTAERIATTLRGAGYQAWIVGGTVRDLLLGRSPKDVDLVTDALPDVVEGLFPRTVAVGKSFGVVIVVEGDLEVEVATFREERGYSDRRRPDEITYATEAAVDARRRDFTCNALFLDPVDGRLLDPTGGARDLAAGLLRTVGEPADRFREDGLRLLRMARFCASLRLDPAPGLLEAATAEAESLDGVSPERVLDELLKTVRSDPALRDARRTLELLHGCGLAERCYPGWPGGREGEKRVRLVGALESCGATVSPEVLIAAALPPVPAEAEDALRSLRASNDLRHAVGAILAAEARVTEAARGPTDGLDAESRGALVELWRDEAAQQAALLAGERRGLEDSAAANALKVGWARIGADVKDAPAEPVELRAADLLDLGVERGPDLGEGLRRVRLASLGGAFTDRESALEWARANLR